MKKLFVLAFASMVLVSVSNVFAAKGVEGTLPETVVSDSTVTTSTDTVAATNVAPSDSVAQ